MRRKRLARGVIGALCAGAVLLPGEAWAQPAHGFGEEDTFVLSVERIFGFQSQDFGDDDDSPSIDSTGLYPPLWGNLGFFSVSEGGLSFGTTVGLTHLSGDLFDEDESVTMVRLGPRVGYAGGTHTPVFGYWVRGGPSTLMFFSDDSETYTFAVSLEAYAVIRPVSHFGVLVGPHADIHLYGKSEDEDAEYSSIGLTVGLMGEF